MEEEEEVREQTQKYVEWCEEHNVSPLQKSSLDAYREETGQGGNCNIDLSTYAKKKWEGTPDVITVGKIATGLDEELLGFLLVQNHKGPEDKVQASLQCVGKFSLDFRVMVATQILNSFLDLDIPLPESDDMMKGYADGFKALSEAIKDHFWHEEKQEQGGLKS